MIRPMAPGDLDRVAAIWLEGNLSAHSFIPASWWRENLPLLREELPRAQVLVWEEKGVIRGFVGIQEGFVAGIFTAAGARGRGIGTALLLRCQELFPSLTLTVYEENPRALALYRRLGFTPVEKRPTQHPGHPEWVMAWKRTEG